MQKALLISILAATILIPLFGARARSLKQAVRRSTMATAVFCVVYWLSLMYVYPSLPGSNKTAGGAAGAEP